jgi:hypothetical protein
MPTDEFEEYVAKELSKIDKHSYTTIRLEKFTVLTRCPEVSFICFINWLVCSLVSFSFLQ